MSFLPVSLVGPPRMLLLLSSLAGPPGMLLLLAALAGCAGPRPGEPDFSRPLSPEEALADFRLDSRFRIEVFAAEPHVRDPVDLAFDAYGRAYVAEMLDYPYEDGSAPRSRIRLLTDADDDGRIDDAVIFADSLQLVTGIQTWNGGLIVTSAPDILFLRDADGDGRADERRTLFTGFAQANPQHRVAAPRFAVDNWIYVANDGLAGAIRPVQSPSGDSVQAGAESVSVLGADFRFRLPAGDGPVEYEPASGPAQFGQAFDAYGRRFITHNTVHVRHVALPRVYFTRNPYLTSAATAHDVSDHGLRIYQRSEPQAWRISRTETRQRRYDEEGVERTERRAHVFTAVAGAAVSGEAAYPPEYRGNLFTGETAANLVHRDVLVPAGPTFTAARGEEETEFLAATDPWFRPCNVVVGPDGHLYVVDMYRAVIESPEYIPESIRRDLDFRRGTEYGRIYRIVPHDMDERSRVSSVADASSLPELLTDPNPWRRLTAHRLLLEGGDRSVADDLEETARRAREPYARLHALYVLDGLGALREDLVAGALADPHPGVREHALRFAESVPSLKDRAAALAADPSDRVRLQAALSLGSFASADSALVRLALRNGDDPWFATAILSAPPERAMTLIEGLLKSGQENASLVRGGASIVGARGDEEEIARLAILLETESPAHQRAAFSGLAQGFELRGFRHLEGPERSIRALLDETDGRVRETVLGAARHFLMPGLAEAAAGEASDPDLPSARRAAAAANLAAGAFDDVVPTLVQLLDSGETDLQASALETLGRFTEEAVAQILLERWEALSPPLRRQAAGVLTSRRSWLVGLVDALEAGRIETEALTTDVRLRLLDHPDESIRLRAAALLEPPAPDGTSAVLEVEGDSRRGRDVFYRECARCHAGSGVGPDLIGVSNKSRDQLLEAVVAPSRAIPATYAAYVAERSDGSVVSGRIVREMPGTLTFRSEEGEKTVLRRDLRALRPASRSLMPGDYGTRLEDRELADVIAFLQAGAGS